MKDSGCGTKDNDRLLRLQGDYKNGDKSALCAMYTLAKEICLKYINSKSGTNKHVAHLSAEEKEEKAHNAAAYAVSRFLEDDGFAIQTSFTGYLYLRVLHELFYRRKVDAIVEFVDWEVFMCPGQK